VPELAALGPVFKSSTPTLLTEEGTEYSVTAIKHVTDAAVVFQFMCSNTVEEQASPQTLTAHGLYARDHHDVYQNHIDI
jgi:coatomer subunit gamma